MRCGQEEVSEMIGGNGLHMNEAGSSLGKKKKKKVSM